MLGVLEGEDQMVGARLGLLLYEMTQNVLVQRYSHGRASEGLKGVI